MAQAVPKPSALTRGDVYWVSFPYVFDGSRKGPINKLALILQHGPLFEERSHTVVVLLTSKKPKRDYPHVVYVPARITGMMDSWIDCGSIYTIERSIINNGSYAFTLPPEIMEEVDDALMVGLCMV